MSKSNIVFIVMDTARAKNVLDQREVMPNLHKIAEQGTMFTNAFTTAPWTLPSHSSMFTGQYTSDHGTHRGSKEFDPDVPTLAEQLQENGYQTVLFSNNTWVSPEFGLTRGYDEFFPGWKIVQKGKNIVPKIKSKESNSARIRALSKELLRRDAPQSILNTIYANFFRKRYDDGARVTNWKIKRWLSENYNAEQPFFMFINYLEPHLKYDPAEEFQRKFLPDDIESSFVENLNQDAWLYIVGDEEMGKKDFRALKALYKAELNYLDDRIGRLYDYLDEKKVLDQTTIIIVGDHGENIGEHGLMDHQYCLYDTLLHVPLMIRCSESNELDSKQDRLIELRDLYPTILDLASIDTPKNDSVSNSSLFREAKNEYVIGEYALPQPSMEALSNRVDEISQEALKYDRGLRCIRTKEWKYIEGTDGHEELYNIADDPEETKDKIADHPEISAELAEKLDSERGKIREYYTDSSSQMDAEVEQQLENLGYIQ
ncbi:sulfatase [Haloferacaceae archaeon DSL9]